MNKALSAKITAKNLELGFLYIPKHIAHLFPSGNNPVKIGAVLDEEGKETELTYNPKYRRLHGLAAFYGKYQARVGDTLEVEVVEPLKRYRIILKRSSGLTFAKILAVRKPDSLVGPPINFRGLMYAPVNENGVIFLFSKVAEDLGITIEGVQVKFPDAFGKRYERDKGYPVMIEFEYKSSDYERHGHPKEGCDLIVCWEHDWKECPMEVLELKTLIKQLKKG